MYNDWFGSTQNSKAYDGILEESGVFTNALRTEKFTKSVLSLEPGRKAYVRIKLRNTGYENWEKSFMRIGATGGASSFVGSGWLKPNRPVEMLEDTVVPGQTATFEFSLDAPSTLASYTEYFQPVAEGKAWIDIKFRYLINVNDPASPENTNYTLGIDEEIGVGDTLLSRDLQNVLALQSDGNLVLYSTFGAKWSTSTVGTKPSKLKMQSDGNLVLYDETGKALWHTRTYSNPGATFKLQTDGNMVVYASGGTALWSSRTVENPNLLAIVSPTLYDRKILRVGQQLETPDRKYRLILQYDGNLVLYSENRALWHTRTYTKQSNYLIMQNDGNLVLYDKDSNALWNSKTRGSGYSRLSLQMDGNLVLYDRNGNHTWHTRTAGQK